MNYIGPNEILNKKKEYYMPCSYHFYKNPPQLVRGEMQYVFDHEGKKYLDFFAGVSVVNCGHCNPVITKATIEQLQTLQHTTTIYLTQPLVDLAEKLASILPGNLKRSFFCNSGSEANEGAMLLARLYTNREEFIYLEGGLHGRTYLTTNVVGVPMWRTDPFLNTDLFHSVSRPSSKEKEDQSLNEIESLLQNKGNQIAAMIMEPIQGNGGIIIPSKEYMKKLKDLLERYGCLLIIDEVQTGFGRSGKMFAIEHFDIIPDFLVTAKALGNGIPISAFSTTDEIASCFTKASASTLGGNLVSATTALAVLQYIDEHQLVNQAKVIGDYLLGELKQLQNKYPMIEKVRGLGLMIGIQLTSFKSYSSSELTDYCLEYMKDHGILIGKNGLNRDVLALQPPLVITLEDAKEVVKQLSNCLEELMVK